MKKQTYNICLTVLLVVCAMLNACKKDFLEINPKGRVIATTTTDYERLLLNLGIINTFTNSQIPMGDELATIEPNFNASNVLTQRLFRWDDMIYEVNQNAPELTVPMQNLYLYNKVINEVMFSTEGTEAQKKMIMAQAKASRAWTYFLLINYFGLPYNETTSTTDPGFPIITAADVTETKFTRASVKEVYNFIVTDLTSALPDLPVEITHRTRMSRAAAAGILGKVYTFMGRFTDAVPQFNTALTDITTAAIPVALYDYNVTLGTGGSFLPISPSSGPSYPTTVNIVENVLAKQSFNDWTSSNNLYINPRTAALYGTNDLRLKFFSNLTSPTGSTLPLGMLRRMGPSAIQYGVVVPDLYLLRAECKARLDDLSGAVKDVETLRKNRIRSTAMTDVLVPTAIASNQKAMVQFVLEERIREFAMTGYRWFDMRRLWVDSLYKSMVDGTHGVYSTTGVLAITFQLRPERLVLRFPQKILDQNPDMQNNP